MKIQLNVTDLSFCSAIRGSNSVKFKTDKLRSWLSAHG